MRINRHQQGHKGSLAVVTLLVISAIFCVSNFIAASSEPDGLPSTLGNYPDTSVTLSGNTTVTPDATPTNITSISVSTNTNFKGTFAASPSTGVVTVTDAHPAGTYTVTAKAFGPAGTATKTFTLTVTGGTPCAPPSTDGFLNAPDVSAGDSPIGIAIGDFNGDGKQDLAIANLSTNPGTVSIRLGNGMGGFASSGEITVVASPSAVAIGDFNGDGKQDFVAVGGISPSYAASVRLGDGQGGFSGSTTISVGSSPYSVAVGDFNGDGKQDFAVGNFNSNTVSIRLGDGLGGFINAPDVSVTHQPNSVAIGDFNGDGKQDLAVANYNIPGSTSIRFGDGLGGFSGSTELSTGNISSSVAIGDFNEDGKQDLAIANYGSSNVSIRLGNGLGGFSGSTEIAVVGSALAIAIGDFNRDGHQDFAVGGGSAVAIRLGDGLGGFTAAQDIQGGDQNFWVSIGDFNGDAKQDLALVNAVLGGPVWIRLGTCNAPVIVFVTTTNDSGPGSLRQAIADAHDQTTIQFDPALNGQTISLTSELVISTNISITGPGSSLLAVAGNLTNFRVFHITSGHTVAISGLTIRNGQAINGGGLFNSGTLTVTNCTVTSNRVGFMGPATMPNNVTGAGIYNEGTLTLVGTTVSGNVTQVGATGGGGITNVATLTISSQSAINSNFAYYSGGGILNSGTLTISDSRINNNQVAPLGHNSGNGGGINSSGTALLSNSTVSGNTVQGDGTGGQGGGIASYGSLDVISSTINGNTSVYGGGIYFYNGGHVTNSTISSNTVQFNGGGIWGGAIVSNSTISGNSSNAQGGGIYVTRNPAELTNTILKAGSSGANIFNNGSGVTSHGYNISSDNGGGFLTGPGDQINTDPLLGPLQNNGGPTSTHALLPGSLAIDTGDPNFTPPPFTDQRGFPRVASGRIDKGSFEVQPTPTPTPCVVLYDQSDSAGGGAVVSQNFETANNNYDAQAADDFVVPANQNWQVQQVKVNGRYFNGPGPATSANVTFYFDAANFPGAVVAGGTFNNLSTSDASGNFTIPLPTNLVLTAGTYWISVQPNLDFNPSGEWAWNDRTVTSNSAAVWQNPGGGFATSCSVYGRRGANCGIDPTAPDQIFQILGCPAAGAPINISGAVSYCSNPSPSAVANVALILSGSAAGIRSSDSSGNYLFSVPSGGNYTVTPSKSPLAAGAPGITTTDVVAVQRHFLTLGTPLSGCRLSAADVNGDTAINTVDVVAIQRFFLIFSTGTANTGKYQFNPVNRTYSSVITNQINQNYDAFVLGDVAPPFVQ